MRAIARRLLGNHVASRPLAGTSYHVVFPAAKHLNLAFSRRITWEPELTQQLADWIPEGGVALDVGANIGIFSLLLLNAVGNAGRVIAFEPDPQNVPWLLLNLESSRGPARIERVAASDVLGEVTLYQDRTTSRTSSLLRDAWHPDPGTAIPIRVQTRPLDTWLGEFERVDFIKIDTEGAELSVLRGAERTLATHHPTVLVEVIEKTWRDVAALLARHGYRLFDAVTGDNLDSRPGHILARV